jgi:hypothetical protein
VPEGRAVGGAVGGFSGRAAAPLVLLPLSLDLLSALRAVATRFMELQVCSKPKS